MRLGYSRGPRFEAIMQESRAYAEKEFGPFSLKQFFHCLYWRNWWLIKHFYFLVVICVWIKQHWVDLSVVGSIGALIVFLALHLTISWH